MAEDRFGNGFQGQGQDEQSNSDGPAAGILSGETGSGDILAQPGMDDWLVLHQAVLAGDKVAWASVAERYMEYVKRVLKSLKPGVDDELLTDATTEALMNYLLHPERFDPSKRSLPSYLVMSANGDLLNLLEKRNNRGRKEILDRHGEFDTNPRKDLYEGADTELWDEIRRNFSADDQTAIRLMLAGIKSYAEYARIWHIERADPAGMRREVKRRKTLLKRKLVRIYAKWKGSSDG